jgi:hypothetical protein
MGRSRRQQRERAVSWTYAEWLKANPAPDYQALAKKWGGGGLTIPEAEWQKFNAAMQEWEARRKNRHLDGDDPTPREPAIVHPESIPGAEIPPDIAAKIEADCKARGIGPRAPLKKDNKS